MKLRINYDFLNKIRNINEPHNPLKVIRNNKNITALYLGANFMFELYRFESISGLMLKMLYYSAATFSGAIMACSIDMLCNQDYYAKSSSNDIKELVKSLNDLHINTNYELFLDSKLYHKEYKIDLNENIIPKIIESKYILVPTYNFNNEIKDVSILQEHVAGSKVYELSLQSLRKNFKYAYSH